jgi:Na+-driven multidrug efflux pump
MAVRGLAYGEFGLPNLGSTVGYGWGFAVQTWFSCIPTTLYLLSHHRRDLDFFSIHSGILGEIWMGLKHTIPLFFQRNSDVLASFGLAIYSGLLGTSASIAENVAESYRMFFGRVGASSVASAVTAEVANVRGRLDLVLSNAIRLPHSQSRGALATISTVRNAGYVTAGVYGVTLATLYIAVPRLLSSAFLDDEQLADDGLMGKLYITLILAGVGGVLDDIRQVQMANQNASKDFKSTYIPIFINFILMLGLSYVLAFPLDLGVVGLEAGNTCCFLISVLMLIKMISVGDRKYTKDLLQENLETGIYNLPFRRAEELLSFSEDDALSSPLIDHDAPKI